MSDTLSATGKAPWRSFLAQFAQAVLILLPFAYFGGLLATAVHEVLGHGLAAVCLGGQFHAFEMDLSGMGWATTSLPPGSPAWKYVLVLAAGVGATLAVGLALLAAEALVRRRLISLILLVLSFNLLLEGAPYVFWNAVHPVPPGDIGWILSECESRWVRAALIGGGGVVMVGATLTLTAMLFRRVEGWLGVNGRLIGMQRIIVLLILGLVPAALWFIFDWNQLAPGLGYLPSVVGAATHALVAASLFWIRFRATPMVPSTREKLIAAMCGYASVGATVAAVIIWFGPL